MGYQLVPALTTLRSQINAKWPNRDKTSDGWIGDTSHSRRVSDHNPDQNGWVHAIDVDKDGIDPMSLIPQLIRDPRVSYVIFNHRIYSRVRHFIPATYTGVNPHEHHVHISALHGPPAMDGGNWAIGGPSVPVTLATSPVALVTPISTAVVKTAGVPALQTVLNSLGAGLVVDGIWGPKGKAAASQRMVKRGDKGPVVRAVQQQLAARGWRLAVDGDFGPGTDKVVRQFQSEKGLGADGIVGPRTWFALWTAPR